MTARVYVYTLLASDGTVLYIGCTDSISRRLGQHKYKPWWNEVARIESDTYPDLETGYQVEIQRIREAQPVYNTDFTEKAHFANGWATRRANIAARAADIERLASQPSRRAS